MTLSSNNLRFYAEFVDINKVHWRINIYKDGYSGTPKELLLADPPVKIHYVSDDIFKPVKYSGATIDLLTPVFLGDLYTGVVTDTRVLISKDINGNGDYRLFWCGSISPNVYNQEWSTNLDATSIECIDYLAVLKYRKYVRKNEAGKTSLYDVVQQCLHNISANDDITKLLWTNSQSLTDGDTDLLHNLYIDEQNFFDEDNEPLYCNEVMEHIALFLGVTITQYEDSIHVFDPLHLEKSIMVYGDTDQRVLKWDWLKYNLTTGTQQALTGVMYYLSEWDYYDSTVIYVTRWLHTGNLIVWDFKYADNNGWHVVWHSFHENNSDLINDINSFNEKFAGIMFALKDTANQNVYVVINTANPQKYRMCYDDTSSNPCYPHITHHAWDSYPVGSEMLDGFTPKQPDIAENNASLSLNDVYNKITVIASILEPKDPQVSFEDVEDNLFDVGDDPGYHIIDLVDRDKKKAQRIWYRFYGNTKFMCMVPFMQTMLNKRGLYYLTQELAFPQPHYGYFIREATLDADFYINPSSNIYTTYYTYNSSLKFKNYYTFRIADSISYLNNGTPTDLSHMLRNMTTGLIVFATNGNANYNAMAGDYLILKFKFKLSKELGMQTGMNDGWDQITNAGAYPQSPNYSTKKYHKPSVHSDGMAFAYWMFRAQLRIGDRYWNGTTWSTTPADFTFRTDIFYKYDNFFGTNYDNGKWPDEFSVENTNTFEMQTSVDEPGFLIPVDQNLDGELYFGLYDIIVRPPYNSELSRWTNTDDEGVYRCINITDFAVLYAPMTENKFTDISEDEQDIKYTTIIQNDIVSEYDDITMYLNTYNPKQLNKKSYSYVRLQDGGYLENTIMDDEERRPEEHISHRYAEYYSQPRKIYQNVFSNNINIEPMDYITIPSINNKMYVNDIEYDLRYCTATVIATEIY